MVLGVVAASFFVPIAVPLAMGLAFACVTLIQVGITVAIGHNKRKLDECRNKLFEQLEESSIKKSDLYHNEVSQPYDGESHRANSFFQRAPGAVQVVQQTEVLTSVVAPEKSNIGSSGVNEPLDPATVLQLFP